MERCPNCGAPARPGAKFCTTCGYRLPAVAPSESASETSGGASSSDSSWPAPPTSTTPEASASAEGQSTDTPEGSDNVIAMPASAEATTEASTEGHADDSDTGASMDSVLSSSWPSPSSPQSDPWTTTKDYGDDTRSDGDQETASVTEEVVVAPAPASQYEGWSAAVVEQAAPAGDASGTNIARAIALLDELRQLLPTLSTGSADETIFAELEAIIAEGNQHAADRQALREALRDARENPRDIQTILALSQQADAAIALLDEHDRLVSTVQQALASRGSQGRSESE